MTAHAGSWPDDVPVALDLARTSSIRDALLIGLAALAELARLDEEFKLAAVCERSLPRDCEPRDPAGDPAALAQLAYALRLVHNAEAEA